MSHSIHESIESTKKSGEAISQAQKNVFKVYKHNVDKYYSQLQKSTADYFQAISDLQQEIIELRWNAFDAAINVQRQFLTKIGISPEVSETTVKFATSLAEQSLRAQNVQNQILMASIDGFRKSIETFNTNTKSFAEMNKNLLESGMSMWIRIKE